MSPLAAEIGDPGYYSVDSVYFSGFSLAVPQEGEAVFLADIFKADG